MATAPAIVRFVGGSVPDALATTRRMHEITLGENPRWSVPVLEFQGTPTGIDVTRVCRTGILPQINTGMAGKLAGVGQVGAGLVTPPAEIFPKALAGWQNWPPERPPDVDVARTAAAACPPRGRPAGPRPGGSAAATRRRAPPATTARRRRATP